MIYADPTEFRLNSPLGPNRPDFIHELTGLEAFTGADFLVTPKTTPVLTSAVAIPQQIQLREMCLTGALVQRKSAGDMASSIPNLHGILQRMRDKSPRCFLAPTGTIGESLEGHCTIDGKVTGWSYKAYVGAIGAWTVDGGLLPAFPLLTNADFYEWLTWLDAKVTERHYKPPTTEVANAQAANPAIATLLTIPGIGPESAKAVLDYCGSLWACLTYLTSRDSLKLTDRVRGIGPERINQARAHFGVPDDAYAIGLYVDKE